MQGHSADTGAMSSNGETAGGGGVNEMVGTGSTGTGEGRVGDGDIGGGGRGRR